VAKLTKPVERSLGWFNNRISSLSIFQQKKVIKMKVWSPKAGIVVKMKLEN
jgi:hypothetical protein